MTIRAQVPTEETSSLSVCCLVADPPGRVAAILEVLRPVADEVIVAVDRTVPSSESQPLAAIADRLYRVTFEAPFERYLPWLHSLCRADWIFRIDGDEVPSASLVDSLLKLTRDPRVLQYRLPRRWLFPDLGHWMAGQPWQPDYQIRIVRNDPATLRFNGTLHSSAMPVLPARHVAEPIYHLALLVSSQEDREARVSRYEAHLGSPDHIDNGAFYLPEIRRVTSVAETPREDRALIERVVSETVSPAVMHDSTTVADVSLSDVVELWPLRELDADAYDVEIACLEERLRFSSSQTRTVPVRVRNRGSGWFPWGDWLPQVRAAYHWLTVDGETVVYDGQRTLLTQDLLPDGEAIVPLLVLAPANPGRYILEIDLVHEGVRWFGCGTRVPATVEIASGQTTAGCPPSVPIRNA